MLPMVDWGRNAYIKQTAIYLKNGDFAKALEMAKEFIGKFPDDMMALFLLAKSHFWSGDYDNAAEHGRKAFNKAQGQDLRYCGILLASAYIAKGMYGEAYKLLNLLGGEKDEDVQKLLFIAAIGRNDEAAAQKHLEALYMINNRIIDELLELDVF